MKRRAFTLVELLVAVTIMMLLVAVSIPAIRTMGTQRASRETARAIHAMAFRAHADTGLNQRASGLALQRSDTNSKHCSLILFAETPAVYAGPLGSSRVRIQSLGNNQLRAQFQVGDFDDNLVSIGAVVRFRFSGPRHTIINGPDSDADGWIDFMGASDTDGDGWIDSSFLVTDAPSNVPWPTAGWSQPVAYQIELSPAMKAADALALPGASIIDLEHSGIRSGGTFNQVFSGSVDTPIIMFSHSGTVSLRMGTIIEPVVGVLYLLVGRREPEDGVQNWQDLNNYWLCINGQTGLAWTAPVAAGSTLIDSQSIAQTAQPEGGR